MRTRKSISSLTLESVSSDCETHLASSLLLPLLSDEDEEKEEEEDVDMAEAVRQLY